MKNLISTLLAIFTFSGCALSPEPETIIVYEDLNLTKLHHYHKIKALPPRAKVDKPISLSEAISKEDNNTYVAVKEEQIVEASKTSRVVRIRYKEAMRGVDFYTYQVEEWNKMYVK